MRWPWQRSNAEIEPAVEESRADVEIPEGKYASMTHEQLARAADPLNRIVNRDVPILGYMPNEREVTQARGELQKLNAAARALNEISPLVVGAIGPESKRLTAEEVARMVERRIEAASKAE